jgi:hypothetical protein
MDHILSTKLVSFVAKSLKMSNFASLNGSSTLYNTIAISQIPAPSDKLRGKTLLRLAAQKRRPHAPLAPLRSTPSYFLCKWGV